ncbi:HlyD family secretion protein [bacterium]|nr:HlyD family secretion protein [bacterium]
MEEQQKTENTEEVKEKEKKQIKGVKRTITLVLLVIMIIGIAYFIFDSLKYQTTDDAYVETTTVSVAPKVSGHIIKVYIKDNQPVNEGDLIAEIDPTDYEISLDKADAAYERMLLNQQNAKANLSASKSNIELAKKDLDRYTKLYEEGAVSKQTLDAAQAKYDSAQANLTNAEQAILSDSDDKVADADLRALKAAKEQASKNLEYTKIYAPQTGTIANRRVEKGMYVNVGSPLCVIVPNEVWIVANFKENQLKGMKPGQVVDIKVDTYPNKVFKGKIDSIQRSSGAKSSLFPPENAVGSFVKIVQRIPVKIVFTEKINPDEYNIVPGMSVVPKVHINE